MFLDKCLGFRLELVDGLTKIILESKEFYFENSDNVLKCFLFFL